MINLRSTGGAAWSCVWRPRFNIFGHGAMSWWFLRCCSVLCVWFAEGFLSPAGWLEVADMLVVRVGAIY